MRCPNCAGETEVLLIDCRLPGEERERVRYCYKCRPQARHAYADCLP